MRYKLLQGTSKGCFGIVGNHLTKEQYRIQRKINHGVFLQQKRYAAMFFVKVKAIKHFQASADILLSSAKRKLQVNLSSVHSLP